MPLKYKSAFGKGKKAVNKAVGYNVHELAHTGKNRPMKQIIAIAESAARHRAKKPK